MTELKSKYHVTSTSLNYDVIQGRDILYELDVIINLSNITITWQEVSILIKPPNCMANEFFVSNESHPLKTLTKRSKQILDIELKKTNLKTIFMNLFKLQKYVQMFDGTLSKYIDSNYTAELKEDAKANHAKPFATLEFHKTTLKKEVDRLIEIGELKKVNNFQRAAPTFIIPKINALNSKIYLRFQRAK